MRVLFIVPYPVGYAPSQRFRVEQLLPLLDANNIDYTVAPFMTERTWNVLYKGGSVAKKIGGISLGFLKRWKIALLGVHKYDFVFIHREASPVGPPVFEWIIARLWKKKVIYDFDDAIWIPNISAENKLAGWAKGFWKVGKICRWSTVVTGGNAYLCDFATRNGARQVVLMPTVVDTETRYKPAIRKNGHTLTIGWTGSHSTLKYLELIKPVIQQLKKKYSFSFLVIADKRPELDNLDVDFVEWNKATEIEDLQRIDIGIMPLTKDQWSEGKCGFKLIQYLSLGIPAVASPVGVNAVIIENGSNGFLADDKEEWVARLSQLIESEEIRIKMRENGVRTIRERFSVNAINSRFIDLFKQARLR